MASLQTYEKVPSIDSSGSFDVPRGEVDPFLDDDGNVFRVDRKALWMRRLSSLAWQLSTLLLAATAIGLAYENRQLRRLESYSTGWNTDLKPVTEAIEIVHTKFTGPLVLDDETKLIRVKEPGVTQYVGAPSPALDQAWAELMAASEIKLEGEQAHPWQGLTTAEEDGSVRIEIEVYHTLHCVDEVRKAIDYDYYYASKDMPYWWRGHVEHCLDYIRQTVMCHADLSPLTFLPEPRLNGTMMPVFGAPHTCRNFDKVHEWAMDRRVPFRSTKITHQHP